jgi:hypothetical protein
VGSAFHAAVAIEYLKKHGSTWNRIGAYRGYICSLHSSRWLEVSFISLSYCLVMICECRMPLSYFRLFFCRCVKDIEKWTCWRPNILENVNKTSLRKKNWLHTNFDISSMLLNYLVRRNDHWHKEGASCKITEPTHYIYILELNLKE